VGRIDTDGSLNDVDIGVVALILHRLLIDDVDRGRCFTHGQTETRRAGRDRVEIGRRRGRCWRCGCRWPWWRWSWRLAIGPARRTIVAGWLAPCGALGGLRYRDRRQSTVGLRRRGLRGRLLIGFVLRNRCAPARNQKRRYQSRTKPK